MSMNCEMCVCACVFVPWMKLNKTKLVCHVSQSRAITFRSIILKFRLNPILYEHKSPMLFVKEKNPQQILQHPLTSTNLPNINIINNNKKRSPKAEIWLRFMRGHFHFFSFSFYSPAYVSRYVIKSKAKKKCKDQNEKKDIKKTGR